MVAAHVNKGLAEHSLMNLDAALDCFDERFALIPKILMRNGINRMSC